MRASATSRLAPPAAAHAARTDNNTPKSDEASPFALLVGAVTPPTHKGANTPSGKGDQKPEADQASTDQAGTAPGASTPTQTQTAPAADSSQQAPADANPGASQTDPALAPDAPQPDINIAALNTNPPQPVSSRSQADADTDTGAGTGTTIGTTIGTAADTTTGGDNVALWPQSAWSASAPTTKAAGADKKDEKEQPAPAAAVPAADLPQPDLSSAAVTPVAAPQASVAATPDDAGQTDIAAAPAIAPATSQPARQPAAQPAPQPETQPALQAANQTPPAQAAPQTAAPAPIKAAASAKAPAPASSDPAQDQTLADNAAQAPVKSQPKPAVPKTDAIAKTAKPVTGKPQQQAGDPAAVKSADATAAQPDDDADDVFKPDAAAPAADAAAVKTVSDAITMPIVGQPAASQTQGPALTQHIQVTAQPHDTAPNLPALAVEIAAKAQAGAKQFDIRLDPPELGRVDVRLSIDATGKASAHLSADQPQTLSLLQKDAPALTRALRDAGLDVSQDGLNFSLRQQAGQNGGAGAQSDQQSGHRSGRGFPLAATTSLEATATSAAYSGAADGRLDIRV